MHHWKMYRINATVSMNMFILVDNVPSPGDDPQVLGMFISITQIGTPNIQTLVNRLKFFIYTITWQPCTSVAPPLWALMEKLLRVMVRALCISRHYWLGWEGREQGLGVHAANTNNTKYMNTITFWIERVYSERSLWLKGHEPLRNGICWSKIIHLECCLFFVVSGAGSDHVR
jgi:hypothetical protein